ncbi:hypothetical protein [Proteus hauseri]|uniref:hypothetical protein n=1 Tax=Proteus hauseri TaxID=183417 RepID=UPI0032DB427C
MKNNKLINYLHAIYPELSIDIHKIKGYSDDEIKKIERLYDIKVTDQLYNFLSCMGRCGGGFFCDSSLLFYRHSFSVRGYVQFQIGKCMDLYNIQQFDLIRQKPFFISIESETQYLFLLTYSDNPNQVYHYDENEEIVNRTDWTFYQYLKRLINIETRKCVNKYCVTGELINILK